MNIRIEPSTKIDNQQDQIVLLDEIHPVGTYLSSQEEISLVEKQVKNDKKQIHLRRGLNNIYLIFENKDEPEINELKEYYRVKGYQIYQSIKEEHITDIQIIGNDFIKDFIEGFVLSAYNFNKYKSNPSKTALRSIKVIGLNKKDIRELQHLLDAVFLTRDLVNEPVIYLTAEQLGAEFSKMGNEAGFSVEVLNKAKIKSLKMGGLLAISEGAPNPPTFSILTYKPKNAINKRPYVLVGKGVVFDTGGLTLKDTPNSMDIMKCDMAGGAAVAGALYCIAKNELPVYIVGLVPATENRPDGNAVTPGDVITMFNKKTVEILNTDAEGRVILADALSYAEKLNPELIIDLATLTGAAIMVLGKEGSVCMGTAKKTHFEQLINAGNQTHERILQLPLWKEYDKEIESSIADYKNIGNGSSAGAITAGAFLKQFTLSPWIHLDIAGPAFLKAPDNYRGAQGTGIGVRLLYQFFKNICTSI